MDKAKEIFGKAWGTVKTKWTDMGKKGHIIFFSVLGVIVASAIITAVLLSNPGYAVLYPNASAEEASEILSVLRNDLSATEATLNANGDILVPKNEVEQLRVQLSILGYPKSNFNYNIWDSGISMFSTESDKRVKEKQQLQENLRATLGMYEGVDSAIVILSIPATNDYVISPASREVATASVVLQTNKKLSVNVIKGIYNLVRTAVPGLKEENITVTDGTGEMLIPEEIIQKSDDDEIELYYKRLELQKSITSILKEKLTELFDGVFSDFRVGVDVQLNYDAKVSEKTEYTPSVDAEGNRGGMVSEEKWTSAGGGTAEEGGLVGAPVDADISPDYPTLQIGNGDEFYYEWQRDINYLVNKEITQAQKDGYSYDNISATVVVDDSGLSQAEIEDWQRVIANAIGAAYDRVTFKAYPFTLDGTAGVGGGEGTLVISGERSTLIFIIIALGALLIILLLIALFASSNSKKRARARKAAAMAAAPEGSASSGSSEDYDMREHGGAGGYTDTAEDFDIQSLSGERTETREDVLKREIRDFSKTNPEIVAQLIRTWMRGDDI